MNSAVITNRILSVGIPSDNYTAVKMYLESDGIVWEHVDSRHDAVSQLSISKYALLLIDVQAISVEETLHLMEWMENNTACFSIPRIFVVGYDKDKERLFQCQNGSLVDLLYHPLDEKLIQSKVKLYIHLAELKQQLEFKKKELNAVIAELTQTRFSLRSANAQLADAAWRDGLTGIANRRRFKNILSEEWTRAKHDGSELSLAFVDIDFFKRYNEAYGHEQGDVCLRRIVRVLGEGLQKPTDVLARYSDKLFVILMPLTKLKRASSVCENMRAQVENMAIVHRRSRIADVVTVSIGLATICPQKVCAVHSDTQSEKNTVECLFSTATSALHLAKQKGRNKVVFFPCSIGAI